MGNKGKKNSLASTDIPHKMDSEDVRPSGSVGPGSPKPSTASTEAHSPQVSASSWHSACWSPGLRPAHSPGGGPEIDVHEDYIDQEVARQAHKRAQARDALEMLEEREAERERFRAARLAEEEKERAEAAEAARRLEQERARLVREQEKREGREAAGRAERAERERRERERDLELFQAKVEEEGRRERERAAREAAGPFFQDDERVVSKTLKLAGSWASETYKQTKGRVVERRTLVWALSSAESFATKIVHSSVGAQVLSRSERLIKHADSYMAVKVRDGTVAAVVNSPTVVKAVETSQRVFLDHVAPMVGPLLSTCNTALYIPRTICGVVFYIPNKAVNTLLSLRAASDAPSKVTEE